MASRTTRADAIEHVVQAAIDFGSAADNVTDAAARALGVNRTDMRVVALLRNRGELPVGRIAQLTALSPAAATTVVRRLGEAGYVAAAVDPSDRRRTVVALTSTAHDRLTGLYAPMLDRGRAWLRQLTLAEMQVVAAVLREAERLQIDLAAGLSAELDAAGRRRR